MVDHIANSSHLQYDGVSSRTSEGRKLQTRLPWMCHSFGAILYTRFCMEYGLHIGDQRGCGVVVWYSWSSSLQGHNSQTYHLAKVLKTTLDIGSVYDGITVRQLLNILHEDWAFHQIRKLSFDLCYCKNT
ncbi:hypothetical protein LPJ71_001839 [Coemansia sp. S17]|nr:hypothetical protein LPJ71_001839 [Coemansia sp. S17]